jgi:hypothetical protein
MKTDTIYEIFRTLRLLIIGVIILGVFYIISNTVIKLADRDLVHLSVVINSLLNITGNIYFSYTITISATVYGYVERRLRRKVQRMLKEKTEQLEQTMIKKFKNK